MLIPDTWEEQLFEVLPIIFLVFAYPNNAVLDDVGHNHFAFCSTFYPYSMRKMKMLHLRINFFVFFFDLWCLS